MDRIKELEAEIAAKKAELRILKENSHLDFSRYHESSINSSELIEYLRGVARAILTIKRVVRRDGSYYVASDRKVKIKELSRTKIKLGNDFLNEIHPIIERYAGTILNTEENNG